MSRKPIQTQPGAPDFDGAEAYEMHCGVEFLSLVGARSSISDDGKFRLMLVEDFDELFRLAERGVGLAQ